MRNENILKLNFGVCRFIDFVAETDVSLTVSRLKMALLQNNLVRNAAMLGYLNV